MATTREAAKAVFSKSGSRVEVETHSFCNRRCNYCPNVVGDRLGKNKQMNLDHWKMILSDLAEIDFSGNFVFTSYNEPLADRSILERLAEARAACPKARMMIYTNGDYLNATYLDEIASAGLDYLHVSIHTRHNGQYSDVDALNLIAKLERRVKRSITYKTLRPGNFVIAAMPHPSLEVEVRAINYNQHPHGSLTTSPFPYQRVFAAPFDAEPVHDYSRVLPTRIGNDVWIGSGAKLKSGITIGDGAVIGAGAVVTHDVEPFSIVGGVPAEPIRLRFSEELIAQIKQLAWWQYNLVGVRLDWTNPARAIEEVARLIQSGDLKQYHARRYKIWIQAGSVNAKRIEGEAGSSFGEISAA